MSGGGWAAGDERRGMVGGDGRRGCMTGRGMGGCLVRIAGTDIPMAHFD